MQNVTIQTKTNGTERNVTLWLNRDGTISLLGNLPHGTQIVVDDRLIADLQKLKEASNEIKK